MGSYLQPRYNHTTEAWGNHRRSMRLSLKRQEANGGLIKKNPNNLFVQVRGRSQTVAVYVNLETDCMKSAWASARYNDKTIGCNYEMFYKGFFRPRHSSLQMWNIKAGDVLTLVPQTDPTWISFLKHHPNYHMYNPANAAQYELWAKAPQNNAAKTCLDNNTPVIFI